MAVKTITVTKAAYEALKAKKQPKESFSEALLRLTNRVSLREFFGVLSKESADRLEKTIKENRKRQNAAYERRIKRIVAALEGRNGHT